MDTPLWHPSARAYQASHMAQFMQQTGHSDYGSLYSWSVDHPEQFWSELCTYAHIHFSHPPERILSHPDHLEQTHWFEGATLNFAEHLLRRRDAHIALIFASENGERQHVTYEALYAQVAKLAHTLQSLGIKAGDRVAGFMPNSIETVVAMLATTALGAIWSACSPDFGLAGLRDRFLQIEPTLLFAVDGHYYNGKTFHHLDKIAELQKILPTLKKTILVGYVNQQPDIKKLDNAIDYAACLNNEASEIVFTPFPFNHPVYILYTSGTTGQPKCMVHGAGGTLLQHKKELLLHTDLHEEDAIFFFTTCGWMMWNWLISSLSVGATIVLYDGFPFYPRKRSLFDLIDEYDISIFGVGAKFIEATAKNKFIPKKTHRLTRLKTILTTGSPLLPESFDFVYNNIKKDVCLSSISGGSDIVSCFCLGNPLLPVYRGEIQCRGLGMKVEVFNEDGKSVKEEQGELVCTAAFPSMPVSFWNDKDGQKYHDAYFNRFPNVWTHGDYAEITKHDGVIIYGRSDATLNPKGVRVGTAEIYNQVEKIPDVLDCIAIGQTWEGSERIILFVTLRDGVTLSNDLIKTIKNTLRDNASPHHVPAKIIQVPDIPRTISGKNVELAVKKIIHGKEVTNAGALANPESLAHFKKIRKLLEQ